MWLTAVNMSVSPHEVLAMRSDLPHLYLDVANDLFRSTWQASHVRLVELVANSNASLALLLARALTGNPAGSLPLEQWLPNTVFQLSNASALAQLIAHAMSDIKQEERWPSEPLAEALTRLSMVEPEFSYSIKASTERRRPCSPYIDGPTYQMFWVTGSHLYLLEVHNES